MHSLLNENDRELIVMPISLSHKVTNNVKLK